MCWHELNQQTFSQPELHIPLSQLGLQQLCTNYLSTMCPGHFGRCTTSPTYHLVFQFSDTCNITQSCNKRPIGNSVYRTDYQCTSGRPIASGQDHPAQLQHKNMTGVRRKRKRTFQFIIIPQYLLYAAVPKRKRMNEGDVEKKLHGIGRTSFQHRELHTSV